MSYFDFNMGAYIQCQDKRCGRLTGLVIDPDAYQVTDLIIEKGHLIKQYRVAPLAAVQHVTDEVVSLSVASDELDHYPEYRVTEYEEPVDALEKPPPETAAPYGLSGAFEPTAPTTRRQIREGIAPGREVIERGMAVYNQAGKFGKIERVVMNRECTKITYLVVQWGMIFSEQLAIPAAMIESTQADGLLTTGTSETLERLPRYDDIVA